MNQSKPAITYRQHVTSTATPREVYEILADIGTHAVWGGEKAPRKDFRLTRLDAPAAQATVGTRFSSEGTISKNGKSVFTDRSVVVEAEPGARFGFDTEATLSRPHSKEWHAIFSHRYTIEQAGTGSLITYVCEVRPQNYTPSFLYPPMKPMMRRYVGGFIRRNMLGLAAMAESNAAAAEGAQR